MGDFIIHQTKGERQETCEEEHNIELLPSRNKLTAKAGCLEHRACLFTGTIQTYFTHGMCEKDFCDLA